MAYVTANKKGFSGRKAVAGVILTGGIGLLAGTLGSNKVVLTCLSCGRRFKPGQGGYTRPEVRRLEQKKIWFSENANTKSKEIYSRPINYIQSTQEPKNKVQPWKTWPVIIVILIILGFIGAMSNKTVPNSKDDESSKALPVINQTYSTQLSKGDSITIKQQLVALIRTVDKTNIDPQKAIKQFSRIAAGLNNYSTNIVQFFQAAKIAKRQMEYAESEISNIQPPEILPQILKDSLTNALSTISSSYSTMSGAFDEAMNEAKHPTDNSYVEAFGSDMTQATQMYAEGLSTILQIQIAFGITQKKKHRSKIQPKNILKN